jgi:hypothetical protein
MGYRSEIAFAIKTEKPIEGLYAILKIAEPNREATQPFTSKHEAVSAFNEIVGCLRVFKKRNMLTFYGNQWKWYGDCVEAYNHLTELAVNYDNDVLIKFAKVGEELEDLEESGVGEDWYELDYPYVSRSLEIDEDFQEEGDEDVETTK